MFWNTLKKILRNYFVAGLLVVLPAAGTVWLLKTIILWADRFFVSLLPEALQPSLIVTGKIPGVGLFFTVAVILAVGVFTRLYLGKKLIELGDGLLSMMPFGRAIYGALKQITKTALNRNEETFKGVCLVEYPKEGSHAIGFITGEAGAQISPRTDEDFLTVFVPTSPNPTSGFVLIVPRSKVRPIGLSVEEATKLVITGGLLEQPPQT